MSEDRNEDDFNDKNNNSNFKEIRSSDSDATWLKKGSKSTFGYKAFATVDDEGFIKKN